MRVMGRNDAVLMVGLTVALFVIFSGPVAKLLDYVREVEKIHGLQLLPALVILATIFSFHQLRKRQEIRAESLSVARAAQEATERAARRALGEADPFIGPTPTEVCFPMIIAGTPEGVLGVAPEPPLTDHQRS